MIIALASSGAPCEELLLVQSSAHLRVNRQTETSVMVVCGLCMQLTDRTRGTGTAAQALRIRYAVQTHKRPPTFAVHVGGKSKFPSNVVKMVRNSLRETFGLQGVPLRVDVRMKDGQK